MKLKKNMAVLGVCACLGIGGFGAYALYIAQVQAVQNRITIVAGGGDSPAGQIVEENWNPSNATDLYPNSEVPKDPKFVSAAQYDGWVIMKVVIPTMMADDDGDDATPNVEMDCVVPQNIDTTNWTLLESYVNTTDTDSITYSEYYYGYNTIVAAGGETTSLFTSIKVPDIYGLDADITDSIDVSATLVQSEGYDTIQAAFDVLEVEALVTGN